MGRNLRSIQRVEDGREDYTADSQSIPELSDKRQQL
jgi:hypothetical protein